MSTKVKRTRYNKDSPSQKMYDNIVKYTALNPNCTKYDLAKNLRNDDGNTISYSTIVNYVKRLIGWGDLTEVKLEKTRTGLHKKGYRITWQVMSKCASSFTRNELINIIKKHSNLAPISVEIIEKAIMASNDSHTVADVISATKWVRQIKPNEEWLREMILDLIFNCFANIHIEDETLYKEFARTVIERLIEANANNDNFKSKVKEVFQDWLEHQKREQIALDIMQDAISKLK